MRSSIDMCKGQSPPRYLILRDEQIIKVADRPPNENIARAEPRGLFRESPPAMLLFRKDWLVTVFLAAAARHGGSSCEHSSVRKVHSHLGWRNYSDQNGTMDSCVIDRWQVALPISTQLRDIDIFSRLALLDERQDLAFRREGSPAYSLLLCSLWFSR
jgi:hypothetical protein